MPGYSPLIDVSSPSPLTLRAFPGDVPGSNQNTLRFPFSPSPRPSSSLQSDRAPTEDPSNPDAMTALFLEVSFVLSPPFVGSSQRLNVGTSSAASLSTVLSTVILLLSNPVVNALAFDLHHWNVEAACSSVSSCPSEPDPDPNAKARRKRNVTTTGTLQTIREKVSSIIAAITTLMPPMVKMKAA